MESVETELIVEASITMAAAAAAPGLVVTEAVRDQVVLMVVQELQKVVVMAEALLPATVTQLLPQVAGVRERGLQIAHIIPAATVLMAG
jgi:hypothetical protein